METGPDQTTLVAARDGTRLWTEVYLPGGPGRFPAVVARTPYGVASNVVWFPAIGRLFADHGMAFVAQDTRGHSASEGALAPFDEARDGWDTLDWITAQRWSDGTTAVFGESYVGFAAAAAAATGHPSLRAAALRNTASDVRGDWMRHGGVVRLEFLVRWALAAWSGRDNLAPELDWAVRPLERIVPALASIIGPDRDPAVLRAWASASEPETIGPDVEPWPSLVDRVRVPTHLTTGWWDLFARGAVRDWSRLARRRGIDSRFVAEPTDHAGHDWSDGPTPDPLADFDLLAARMPTILASEVAFLEHHLLGRGPGAPSAASWMLTNAEMRHSRSWPPPDATRWALHLVDGGRARRGPEGGGLSTHPDRVPVRARWTHDPADPVPAFEGDAIEGWFHAPDERVTQVRDDVLTFTSEPFRAPVDLAGPVVAELLVAVPDVGGHLMAKLCDVHPDGTARRIVDGACLVTGSEQELVARIELGDTGYRVRPGHRLRLEVSSSAFPRYILHPGTAADPWTAPTTKATELEIQTGADASCLHLTVVP